MEIEMQRLNFWYFSRGILNVSRNVISLHLQSISANLYSLLSSHDIFSLISLCDSSLKISFKIFHAVWWMICEGRESVVCEFVVRWSARLRVFSGSGRPPTFRSLASSLSFSHHSLVPLANYSFNFVVQSGQVTTTTPRFIIYHDTNTVINSGRLFSSFLSWWFFIPALFWRHFCLQAGMIGDGSDMLEHEVNLNDDDSQKNDSGRWVTRGAHLHPRWLTRTLFTFRRVPTSRFVWVWLSIALSDEVIDWQSFKKRVNINKYCSNLLEDDEDVKSPQRASLEAAIAVRYTLNFV